MHDDELEAMVQQLADLLATAPQELRSKFRYAIEEFQQFANNPRLVGAKEARRHLVEAIKELKAAKDRS